MSRHIEKGWRPTASSRAERAQNVRRKIAVEMKSWGAAEGRKAKGLNREVEMLYPFTHERIRARYSVLGNKLYRNRNRCVDFSSEKSTCTPLESSQYFRKCRRLFSS